MVQKKIFGVISLLVVVVMAITLDSCKEEKHYHDYFDKRQLKYVEKLGKKPKFDDRHMLADTSWVDKDSLHRIVTTPLPGDYEELFADYNSIQLPPATDNGIEPIENLHDAYRLRQPLVKIASCEAFFLDSLTHSMPFLVPKAALLLEDIGCAFSDSVCARGGSPYQIIVTSCTRSKFTVSKLLKVNQNASERSCHMFGTTFDLSWVRFMPYNNDYRINAEDLKNVLGHVLLEFKNNKRCAVLYEIGQCCFHITVI